VVKVNRFITIIIYYILLFIFMICLIIFLLCKEDIKYRALVRDFFGNKEKTIKK
jgi:hypothetical protein